MYKIRGARYLLIFDQLSLSGQGSFKILPLFYRKSCKATEIRRLVRFGRKLTNRLRSNLERKVTYRRIFVELMEICM